MTKRVAALAAGAAVLTLTLPVGVANAAPAPASVAAVRAAASPPQPTVTIPEKVRVQYLTGSTLTWAIDEADYDGTVTVLARAGGAVLGTGTASNGTVQVTLPGTGLATTDIKVRFAATDTYRAVTYQTTMVGYAPRLTVGMRTPLVRALLKRLDLLGYLRPELTDRYSGPVSDVVLAFQKYQQLPRTGVMSKATWVELERAVPVKARHGGKGTHIEVDKTRQILIVARGRKVLGTIHVSTGKTGNTPVGTFRIYERNNWPLWRWMRFYGNFGIHAYTPVPPYPASHGCVRVPFWAADWTWDRSPNGTKVIIYA